MGHWASILQSQQQSHPQPQRQLEHQSNTHGTKKLTVVTVGKTGSGKSSLVRELLGVDSAEPRRPCVKSGLQAGSTEPAPYENKLLGYKIIDTPGLLNVHLGNYNQATVNVVEQIVKGSVPGVLLVCIEMHSRLDVSTMQVLALLHNKHGEKMWDHVVIALTRADEYPEHAWTESTPANKPKNQELKERFEKELEEAKIFLKNSITSQDAKTEACHIGLSQEAWMKCKIPIIPTSQSIPSVAKKMKQIKHGHWLLEIRYAIRAKYPGTTHSHQLMPKGHERDAKKKMKLVTIPESRYTLQVGADDKQSPEQDTVS